MSTPSDTLHTYTIGIGSNTTDASRRVADAIRWLGRHLQSLQCSSSYTTPSCGSKTTADYTNAVARGQSCLDSNELTHLLKHYEAEAGRTPEASARGEVVIDLDLVIADNHVLRPRDLNAPYFTPGLNQL